MDKNFGGEFDYTNIPDLTAEFFAEKIRLVWHAHRHETQDAHIPIWDYYEGNSLWFVQIKEFGIDTVVEVCAPSQAYGGPSADDILRELGQPTKEDKRLHFLSGHYGVFSDEFLRDIAFEVYMEVERVLGKQIPTTIELENDNRVTDGLYRGQYPERLANYLSLNFPDNSEERLLAEALNHMGGLDGMAVEFQQKHAALHPDVVKSWFSSSVSGAWRIGQILEVIRQKRREQAFVSGWKLSASSSRQHAAQKPNLERRNKRACKRMEDLIGNRSLSRKRAAEIVAKQPDINIGFERLREIFRQHERTKLGE